MIRLFAATLAIALLASPSYSAQDGVQQTPDGAYQLVNKTVNGERWIIMRNQETGAVIGNIDSAGGTPQFVSCGPQGDGSSATEITLVCSGASACDASPCTSTDWTSIGTVTVPASFFLPKDSPPPLRDGVFEGTIRGSGSERQANCYWRITFEGAARLRYTAKDSIGELELDYIITYPIGESTGGGFCRPGTFRHHFYLPAFFDGSSFRIVDAIQDRTRFSGSGRIEGNSVTGDYGFYDSPPEVRLDGTFNLRRVE
jgi:hypothetical protein